MPIWIQSKRKSRKLLHYIALFGMEYLMLCQSRSGVGVRVDIYRSELELPKFCRLHSPGINDCIIKCPCSLVGRVLDTGANWYVAARFEPLRHSISAADRDGLWSVAAATLNQDQMTSVEWDGLCPALGQVKCLMLNPASCPGFPNQMVEIRITATSSA